MTSRPMPTIGRSRCTSPPTSKRMRLGILSAAILVAVPLVGCSDGTGPGGTTVYSRGEIISAQKRAGYSVALLEQVVGSTGLTLPAPLSHPVDAYQVTYATVDATGADLRVSGALLVPTGAADLPLASIQHGTETLRSLVASTNPLQTPEGALGLLMASIGYVVVIPDYPGFGVSTVRHPYLHAASLVPSVVDLLRAAKTWTGQHSISLNGQVFLAGYSEGGFVTLATQKAIEEEYSSEFTLTAVAPMAGPYDLLGTTRAIFQAGTYGNSPAYLAYIMSAYDDIYGWDRLGDFFNAPFATLVPGLFDGTKSWPEVESALDTNFAGLFKPAFIDGIVNGTETEVLAALAENTLLDWRPVTPTDFIQGTADDVVPYQNSLTAVSTFDSLGATNVLLTPIAGGDHASAAAPAAVAALTWFEGFRTGAGIAMARR
jgi:pimeloyl-ACP methyl ester carboxylesterase